MTIMRMAKKLSMFIATALLLAGCQSMPDPSRAAFVAVPGFGAAVDVPGASARPHARSDVRAVFPATRAAPSPDKVAPALDKAARYLNLLAQQGIRIRPGDVVVVVSGPATPAVLVDEAYRGRAGKTGIAANPNLPLIRALREAGAVVSVCGQALHGQKIAASDVAPEVRRDLSAMTTLVELQSRGYALVTE